MNEEHILANLAEICGILEASRNRPDYIRLDWHLGDYIIHRLDKLFWEVRGENGSPDCSEYENIWKEKLESLGLVMI